MNDLDDTTFERFARKFARIERLVPEPSQLRLSPVARHRSSFGSLARAGVLAGVVVALAALLGVVAIGSRPAPAPTVPPDSAPPGVVLDAYLHALRAGDCDTASRLTVPLFFGEWNSRLCSVASQISDSHVPESSPFRSGFNTTWVSATLAITDPTRGLSGTEFAGQFELQQQPSGAWRIFDVSFVAIRPFGFPGPLPS